MRLNVKFNPERAVFDLLNLSASPRLLMKIGFVVNRIETEKAVYTTTRLAHAAQRRGHAAYVIGVGDLVQKSDGSLHARAKIAPDKKFSTNETYFNALQKTETIRVEADDFDVIMLRNDPATDAVEHPWAAVAGYVWGQLAAARGILVVNDPHALADATNKLYFQHFPTEVRPATLITRAVEDVREFYDQHDSNIVIKPLQGSGGASVFLVGKGDKPNLNQMVEAITRDGYVVAQEYLSEADKGDVRLFVMNGKPLQVKGKTALFRRVNNSGDLRSNMHVGGKSEPAEYTEEMHHIVETVRPKLVADGMFLVGIDIVGDKLMEINVFSPGGFGSTHRFTGIEFSLAVIEDLERKVFYKTRYRHKVSNQTLATM